jgi:hypothetical protein
MEAGAHSWLIVSGARAVRAGAGRRGCRPAGTTEQGNLPTRGAPKDLRASGLSFLRLVLSAAAALLSRSPPTEHGSSPTRGGLQLDCAAYSAAYAGALWRDAVPATLTFPTGIVDDKIRRRGWRQTRSQGGLERSDFLASAGEEVSVHLVQELALQSPPLRP